MTSVKVVILLVVVMAVTVLSHPGKNGGQKKRMQQSGGTETGSDLGGSSEEQQGSGKRRGNKGGKKYDSSEEMVDGNVNPGSADTPPPVLPDEATTLDPSLQKVRKQNGNVKGRSNYKASASGPMKKNKNRKNVSKAPPPAG